MAPANEAERTYWNSPAGAKWVTHQHEMDTVFAAVTDRVTALAAPRPGERAIDIGCGTGVSTRAVAAGLAPGGAATGIDISEVMLARAREVPAEGVSYLLADAQTHPFAPGAADLVVSRFGVMFFDDPAAAFANIRAGVRPGGRLVFAAWAALERNPWFRIPRDVAVARLGPGAPRDPHAPGPTAFADIARVEGILRDAGWTGVEGREEEVGLHHPGGVGAAARLAGTLGPAARLMKEKAGTEADGAAILAGLEAAFAEHAAADGLRMTGRLNVFTARVPESA